MQKVEGQIGEDFERLKDIQKQQAERHYDVLEKINNIEKEIAHIYSGCRVMHEGVIIIILQGRKHELSASQAHPVDFGKAYGELVASNYSSNLLKSSFRHIF